MNEPRTPHTRSGRSSRRSARQKRLHMVVYLCTILGSLLFLSIGHRIASSGLSYLDKNIGDATPYHARVLKIYDRQEDSIDIGGNTMIQQVHIRFSASILNGDREGDEVVVVQNNDSFAQLKEVEPGDKVLVYYSPKSEDNWLMGEYVRTDGLLTLGIIFLVMLLIFGRRKGVNTILSLVFTCMAIFLVFIPSVLSGFNIYLSSMVVCTFIIVMTLLIVSGVHRKTMAACCGCIAGVLVCAILTLVMDGVLHITGLVDEQSMYLVSVNPDAPINLRAIIFASIIIGAVGAIMDVAISMASSLWELYEHAAEPTPRVLVHSGFAIGRDMMGTMSNTLILAYIGSSLSIVLLLLAYNHSMMALLNREMIVVEILQSLVGSIGILCTIPLTAVLCAVIYPGYHRRRPRRERHDPTALDHAFEDDFLE